ncbi:Phosphoserine phosphatase 1 [compost metagenome]
MKLLVARHGQTEWNYENRICGVSNIELTDKGLEQARLLASKVKDYHIDIILSSPLKRALKTAEIISDEINRDIIVEDRLIEQNYGSFEGLLRTGEGFRHAKKQFPNKLGGGESILQVVQRVYNLLDEIIAEYADKNVMIISHGSVCRVINSYFNECSNQEYNDYYTKNGELVEYFI